MIELFGSFAAGLVGAVPRLVTSWVETRNAIRIEYTRAHLSRAAEEQRVRTAARVQQIQFAAQAAAGYPLGVPGRLRALLRPSGLPTILVSPPPPGMWSPVGEVTDRIRELLTDIDGFAEYARLPSGAFVRDAGGSRFIDGEMGARTIATSEFGREPAILIYFDTSPRSLTAHAYLSTVFGSVGGDSGFSFTIARYSRGVPAGLSAVLPRDSDLPSWHHVDLTALAGVDPAEVIAHTITWFLLATVDAYWRTRSGIAAGLLAQTEMGISAAGERPAPTATVTGAAGFLVDAPVRRARLERDARELADTGYAVTAEELDDGLVGLHVRGAQDVIFVVDSAYPQIPPAVIWAGDVEIELDAAGWSPECTLADIVEAVR